MPGVAGLHQIDGVHVHLQVDGYGFLFRFSDQLANESVQPLRAITFDEQLPAVFAFDSGKGSVAWTEQVDVVPVDPSALPHLGPNDTESFGK